MTSTASKRGKRSIKKSLEWTRRADQCIAQGCLTNSKHRRTHVRGVYPTAVVRGNGAVIYDADGNSYSDFICGLGSNLVGYANERVNRAIYSALAHGASHSLPTTYEVEAAERLKELFPFVERFKFLKTGSEACVSAVKIARAATGRSLILSDGYHGHAAEFTSLTPPASGCAPHPYIKQLSLGHGIGSDVAAVIVEPVITDYSEARINWLRELITQCHKAGALVIFDEIISGFRFPDYSVTKHHKLKPDLICLGKAIANGMPLAAVGGRAELMDGDFFVSSTYAGEIGSLAACNEVCSILQSDINYKISDLWTSGTEFIRKFNELGSGLVTLVGYPTRGAFVGDDVTKALFFQEAVECGILFGPSWFYNFPLVKHQDAVIFALSQIFPRIRRGEVKLRGELPQKPFAQQVRDGGRSK